jgi:hypothetical protein
MINLLPPIEKEEIMYARYNTQLRRWIVGAFMGLVGVVVVVLGGQMILRQSTNSYQHAIDESKARLAQQNQKETLEHVKDIQDSFKLVVDVLSREVLFSKLLPQVGLVMPSSTVLEELSPNTEEEQTAFDLTASARDYVSGSQIQVNLTDPTNKLFEKADLVTVSCPAEQEEPTEYPCDVSMRVQPAKENPFLLISSEAKR